MEIKRLCPTCKRVYTDETLIYCLADGSLLEEVVKAYDVFDEERFVGSRATFVIDKDGIIHHVEQGASAIDPTGAYQACSAF
ncbi:MAG: redoxin domain-containing protein [Acidobacteria bacterium]|nr:redoxin domain-containing protein [Acidobacteriota bacterium]